MRSCAPELSVLLETICRASSDALRRPSCTPTPTHHREELLAGIEIPVPASWPAVRASMELIEALAAAEASGAPAPPIRARAVHTREQQKEP